MPSMKFTKSIDDKNMNQSKLSKFLSSAEITEHVSELLYLLEFFSKTRHEQWDDLPDDFAPCWVDLTHGNAETPVLFLELVCSSLINYCNVKLLWIMMTGKNIQPISCLLSIS